MSYAYLVSNIRDEWITYDMNYFENPNEFIKVVAKKQ